LHASNYPDTLRNMRQKPVVQDQTQRSRRWRTGVATRLAVIEERTAALPEMQQQLAALTDLRELLRPPPALERGRKAEARR
jgi:hypothetical protein